MAEGEATSSLTDPLVCLSETSDFGGGGMKPLASCFLRSCMRVCPQESRRDVRDQTVLHSFRKRQAMLGVHRACVQWSAASAREMCTDTDFGEAGGSLGLE